MQNARPWLEQYSGQTVGELISLEAKYRMESLLVAFVQGIEQAWVRRRNSGEALLLTDVERTVLGVEAMGAEVNNGGYKQFFQNSSREYAPTIVLDLKTIGCQQTAKTMQKAILALGTDDLSEESIKRIIAIDDQVRDQILEECDQTFYNCYEPIAVPLFEYIRAHQSEIRL